MAHPTVYNTAEVLNKFQSPSTLKGAGVSTYLAKQQLAAGLIKQAGKVETGQRGRPAALYVLTDEGRQAATPTASVATSDEG